MSRSRIDSSRMIISTQSSRSQNDAGGAKDVVHGQDAGASVSGIRDPAHGLGGE
jgi:hypothetical protein